MKTLVLTMVGKDRPGLINLLSNIIVDHQGDWIDSHFGRLAGQFAGIAEISLPAAQVAALTDKLTQLEGLQISLQDGEPQATSEHLVKFLVTANDRQGIVKEISDCLLSHSVNVLQMETHRSHAPNWGGELFGAEIIAELPESMSEDQLQQQLESLSDDLVVDMEFDFPT